MIEKVMRSDDLRKLCIKNNWFTCGTIRQYDMLFLSNELGESIETLATIIWICSNRARRKDIIAALQQAHEEYLKNGNNDEFQADMFKISETAL